MKKDVTWYKVMFEVTWHDGTTEDVESHHVYDRDTLHQRGPKVFVKKFDYIDVRKVGYLRPWKRSYKLKTDIHMTTERTLNFEQIKNIDLVESEEVVETVEAE